MKKKLERVLAFTMAFVMVCALGGCSQTPSSEDATEQTTEPTVACANGVFVGLEEAETGVLSFLGIPFAKSPVGELRWKAPEAPDASEEIFQANAFGKSSIQYEWPTEPASYNEIGEDCLTLNVWTKDLEVEGKPVMVYFHGGGFAWGGSADPMYNGQNFVNRHEDIVAVSANYRIGMMGFIDFSQVEGGEAFADAPLLGILDQMQALKWVQENATAFGGDPNNVTIFGESAGGSMVALLTTIPEAEGLFQKCIAQSGSLNLTYSQEEFDEIGLTAGLLELTGATTMDELMAIPEEELIAYYFEPLDEYETCLNDLYNMPMRGRGVIPENPYQNLADGVGKDVVFMTGTNKNEWNYWINEMGLEDIEEAVAMYEEVIVDDKIDTLKEMASAEENAKIDAFLALQTDKEDLWAKTEFCNDIGFRVPSIVAASNHADAGGMSYMYYFAKESTQEYMGACHASELAYVFHNTEEELFTGAVDEKLADKICDAWANFARTGDPSTEDVQWTPYDSDARNTMMIGNDCSMEMQPDPLTEQRELTEPLLEYYTK